MLLARAQALSLLAKILGFGHRILAGSQCEKLDSAAIVFTELQTLSGNYLTNTLSVILQLRWYLMPHQQKANKSHTSLASVRASHLARERTLSSS